MPTRMPNDTAKRGFLKDYSPVIAITRHGAVWYRSLEECRLDYGIRSHVQLQRLIDKDQVGPDGYTTFELPIEGVVYEGMDEEDIKAMKERIGGGKERSGGS